MSFVHIPFSAAVVALSVVVASPPAGAQTDWVLFCGFGSVDLCPGFATEPTCSPSGQGVHLHFKGDDQAAAGGENGFSGAVARVLCGDELVITCGIDDDPDTVDVLEACNRVGKHGSPDEPHTCEITAEWGPREATGGCYDPPDEATVEYFRERLP